MDRLLVSLGVLFLASLSAEGKAVTNDIKNVLEGIKPEPALEPTADDTLGEDVNRGNKSRFLDLHVHVCFPSDAYTRNEDGKKIEMKDLKIGDKVLTMDNTGRPKYTEVILMLHQDHERTIDDYVNIKCKDGASMTLSTHHLINIYPSQFIYGKDVRPGHKVIIYNEQDNTFQTSEVTSVELVTRKGLYAPLSMEGTLVVNDVYASCYASFPSQSIAHVGFSLWRVMYTYFHSLLDLTSTTPGIHWYPRMLMSISGF